MDVRGGVVFLLDLDLLRLGGQLAGGWGGGGAQPGSQTGGLWYHGGGVGRRTLRVVLLGCVCG